MASTPEERAHELGLVIPNYEDPPFGGRYGKMKAFHRSGRLVLLSGITPEDRDGTQVHPGQLGGDLTVEQGYEAARKAAVNCLGMTRLALGSLDEVASMARVLCFIVAAPDFYEHHLVSAGASDVFIDVFGPDAGIAGSAAIGVTSLSRNNSIELWVDLESRSDPE